MKNSLLSKQIPALVISSLNNAAEAVNIGSADAAIAALSEAMAKCGEASALCQESN